MRKYVEKTGNIIGYTIITFIGLWYISQVFFVLGLVTPIAGAKDPASEALMMLDTIKQNQISIQHAKDSNRELVIGIRKEGYEVNWETLDIHRQSKLSFSPLSHVKYWEWVDAPEYKKIRLRYYQDLLRAAGVTNIDHLKNLTSQLTVENGALDPLAIGDNGCSLGLPQINFCVHHGVYASTWLKRNPEWNDWKLQAEVMTEWITSNYERYDGDIFRTVVHHNSPAAAYANVDTNAGYWSKVVKNGNLLSLSK